MRCTPRGSLDDSILAEHVGLGLVVGVHYRPSPDEHGSGLHRGRRKWASQGRACGQWAARGNRYLLSSPCLFAAFSACAQSGDPKGGTKAN